MDWVYKQIIGFLANFFAEMGNMGAEMFEMSWVQSIVLFFSYLAWILYAVGFVVACAECGLEYSSGRADIKGTAMNLIKGFMAVSLFTVVPIRLYELCVSLQANFGYAISGAGASFGTVAGNIIDELTVENFVDFATTHVGGFGSVTSPIMVLFCIILMAYAVIKVFFANLKRHPAHPDRGRQSVYVFCAARVSGRVLSVVQAGRGALPHGLFAGYDPDRGADAVQ